MIQELINRVSLVWVNAEQVCDQILGCVRDRVPPWTQESVLTAGDLVRERLDGFIVERWEAAKHRVKHASQGPHIHGLGVFLVTDDLRCSVSDGTARRQGRVVPNDLGQTKVGNLDLTDTAAANAWLENTFIFLVFIKYIDRLF